MVSIFDKLNTILDFLAEFFSQLLNALRIIPNFITECGTQVQRYHDCFPPFLWFLVAFAFGAGIISKLLHWGS